MEYFIIFLPLIGSIISGLFGKKISSRQAEILTSGLVTTSAILSLIVFFKVLTQGYENNIIISTWINSPDKKNRFKKTGGGGVLPRVENHWQWFWNLDHRFCLGDSDQSKKNIVWPSKIKKNIRNPYVSIKNPLGSIKDQENIF